MEATSDLKDPCCWHNQEILMWKQTKSPLTEKWIKKMWHIYTVEYYSAIKKTEIMQFAATWMDLEMIILSEVNQTEEDKYHIVTVIHGI